MTKEPNTMNYRIHTATLITILALLIIAAPARAADPPPAAQTARTWLLSRQQKNGSFPGFDAGASADAIFALVSMGTDPNSIVKNGNSALTYLETQTTTYATKSTAAAAKLTLALIAADKNPLNFGGQNLITIITNQYNPKTGRYGTDITSHAFALLALASAGQPITSAAQTALTTAQLPDGGWSFDGTPATGSDTNTTALALQALIASNASHDPITRAIAYLHTQQNRDGGFPYAKTSSFGSDSDANSTATVIQALIAAQEDPYTWKQPQGNPLQALLALQNPNGAFRYQLTQPNDNDLATAQAIPALMLRPLPLKKTNLPAQNTVTQPTHLPTTGSNEQPTWLLTAAILLCITGLLLKTQHT